MAQAPSGDGAWERLGLLTGSSTASLTNAATALTFKFFCSEINILDNRRALPGLTDEDITWLCGPWCSLPEEMGPLEAQPSLAAVDSLGTDGHNSQP